MDAHSLPRILLVDDNEHVLRALVRNFSRKFQVRTATNVTEALALLNVEPFDAVISDMEMPDGFGIELHAWVTTHRPATPIFLHSGNADLYKDKVPRGVLFEKGSLAPLCAALAAAMKNG